MNDSRIRGRSLRSWSWTRRRIVFLIVGILVLFVGVAVALEFGLNASKVHPGVSVLGVDLGGKTEAQAAAELNELVHRSDQEPIVVRAEDRSWPALPPALGRSVDVEGTVSDALAVGREDGFLSSLWSRVRLYFSPRSVPLRVALDPEPRDVFISSLAEEVDQPPVNAGLTFKDGRVEVVQGRDGLVVDRQALAAALADRLATLASTEIELPLVTAGPAIAAADTGEAVALARVMIGGEVKLTAGDKSWLLSVGQIESCLDCRVEGQGEQSKLVPFVAPQKLAAAMPDVVNAVRVPPKDATWDTDGQNATVVPAVPGKELDPTSTALAIDAAAKSPSERTAEVVLKEVPAKRTTEIAEKMGIKEKLGDYSIGVYGSWNRQMNLKRATELIDGTLVAPGEEFSFNKVVGNRTAANGFNTAPVIQADGRLEDALGGGVCQVATTLFNAAFFAGLKITERANHMLYIDHYPMGRDATVDYGSQDLKFVNDTDHWILIRGAVGDSVKFVIYGTSDGRKVAFTTSGWYGVTPCATQTVINPELKPGETKVKNSGQTGRSCTVKRTVTRNGVVLRNDTFYSVFPAITRVVEQPDPKATTTTTTAPTTSTTQVTPTTPTTQVVPPTTTTTVPASSTTTTTAAEEDNRGSSYRTARAPSAHLFPGAATC